jgi:ribosomal protein RSM22 (predicted rRNA methylase)
VLAAVRQGENMEDPVSLRDYLTSLIDGAEKRSDERFEAMKAMVQEAFVGSQKAIDKAERATELRFESVNEFRAQLSDQSTRFVTRDTVDALMQKLETEIARNRQDLDDLAKRVDLREGVVAGSRFTIGHVIAIATLALAVIGTLVVVARYSGGG